MNFLYGNAQKIIKAMLQVFMNARRNVDAKRKSFGKTRNIKYLFKDVRICKE
jgi:hypothetical protein